MIAYSDRYAALPTGALRPAAWHRWEQARAVGPAREAETEDYQGIGVRLRECLVSLVGVIANDGLVSKGTVPPKAADFQAWFAFFADAPDPLPAPLVIITGRADVHRVAIEGDGSIARVRFVTLGTVGEQGEAFDNDGREASVVLIEYARRFIEREGLTGTDPESLALAAAESPKPRAALIALDDAQ